MKDELENRNKIKIELNLFDIQKPYLGTTTISLQGGVSDSEALIFMDAWYNDREVYYISSMEIVNKTRKQIL